MNIIETSKYKKTYKKIIIDKHLSKEKEVLNIVLGIIELYPNLQSLMNSLYQSKYDIRQKEGNLKEYISVSINQRIRLIIKPISELPYNYIEIVDIELVEVNDDHYKRM